MIKKITFETNYPLYIATYKRKDNITPEEIYIEPECKYAIKDNEIIISGNNINRILLPYNNHKIDESFISNHHNDTLIEISDKKHNLEIFSQSGNIELKNTDLNECKISSLAGEIVLKNSSFNKLEISGFSKPICIENSIINKQAILRNSDGDININKSYIKWSKIRTDSGDITINDCNKTNEQIVNVRSANGMIKVNNSEMIGTNIHTLLGTITINNSKIKEAVLGLYREGNNIILKKSQIESLLTESYLPPKIIGSQINNHKSTILEDLLSEGDFKTSEKTLVLKLK